MRNGHVVLDLVDLIWVILVLGTFLLEPRCMVKAVSHTEAYEPGFMNHDTVQNPNQRDWNQGACFFLYHLALKD